MKTLMLDGELLAELDLDGRDRERLPLVLACLQGTPGAQLLVGRLSEYPAPHAESRQDQTPTADP